MQREDESSPLIIKEIRCPVTNNCNAAVLGKLQLGILNPTENAVLEGRRLAILDAIPTDYIYNKVVEYRRILMLNSELLVAYLGEITISSKRQGVATVRCQKLLVESDWQCRFMLLSVVQHLENYNFAVSLSDDRITEIDVLTMVELVVNEFDSPNGEIISMQVASQDNGYRARVHQSGLELFVVNFDQSLKVVHTE